MKKNLFKVPAPSFTDREKTDHFIHSAGFLLSVMCRCLAV
jgi:hypothetical protein